MTVQLINRKKEISQTASPQDMTAEYQTCNKQEFLSQNVIEVGFIEKGTGKHQSNTIYDSKGVSPCLNSVNYKEPIKVIESEK